MMSLKLQDGVNVLPLQIKQVKMTKQIWDKLSLDTRANMLMSVVKDPDEAEEYTEYEWDQLPSEVVSNMLIHVK
jgi:hypothetical protein